MMLVKLAIWMFIFTYMFYKNITIIRTPLVGTNMGTVAQRNLTIFFKVFQRGIGFVIPIKPHNITLVCCSCVYFCGKTVWCGVAQEVKRGLRAKVCGGSAQAWLHRKCGRPRPALSSNGGIWTSKPVPSPVLTFWWNWLTEFRVTSQKWDIPEGAESHSSTSNTQREWKHCTGCVLIMLFWLSDPQPDNKHTHTHTPMTTSGYSATLTFPGMMWGHKTVKFRTSFNSVFKDMFCGIRGNRSNSTLKTLLN